MKRKLSTILLALTGTLTAMADGEQTVNVNGATVEKTVRQITFDGDVIVLHYADGTQSESVDMNEVSIVFGDAAAIEVLKADMTDAPVFYFDMQGRQLPGVPAKGMYLMKKGNKVVKVIKK